VSGGVRQKRWRLRRVARPNLFDRACPDTFPGVRRHAQAALGHGTHRPDTCLVTILSCTRVRPEACLRPDHRIEWKRARGELLRARNRVDP
jgi:hypothetical protein